MLNPVEIRKRFDALPAEEKRWTLKIGDPVEVRHSDRILPLWEILEAISAHGASFCRYVEIFGDGGSYSVPFDGQAFLPICNGSAIASAVRAETEALKAKSGLTAEEKQKKVTMF